MNNENTILDSRNVSGGRDAMNNTTSSSAGKSKSGFAEGAAYAVGGAAVGAGLAAAGQAVAGNATTTVKAEDVATKEDNGNEAAATAVHEGVTVEANGTTVRVTGDAEVEVAADTVHVRLTPAAEAQATPHSDEAIVATATDVRVAHVDDSLSFSQAFAEARTQVGPGGVFEWHGRAYNTFYKEEWDHMSPEERAAFQASIDYDDILSDDVVIEPEVEVRVLDVTKVDLDGDGEAENAALLDINGNEVVIIDTDNDNVADVAVCDINDNEQLDEDEIADISGEGIMMPTEADIDDGMVAMVDDTPDYVNDADTGLYEV